MKETKIETLGPIPFTFKEKNILNQAKEKHGGNWHDFILYLARSYIKGGANE